MSEVESRTAGSTSEGRPAVSWRDQIGSVWAVIRLTSPSAALAAVGAILVGQPDQSIEAIRVAAEEFVAGRPGELLVMFAAAAFAGLMAWYWARVLTYVGVPPNVDTVAGRWATAQLPRVWAALPTLGLSLGAARASTIRGPEDTATDHVLTIAAILAALLAVVLYVGFVLRRVYLVRRTRPLSAGERQVKELPRETRLILLATILLWLGMFTAAVLSYGQAVRSFGPIAILLVSIGTWIPAVSSALYLGIRWRFPVVRSVLAWVVLIAALNLNDNHEIRTVQGSQRKGLPPEFSAAFTNWLQSRADLKDFDPYPVFLVATEGGGLRAAYFTALVLSSLQDWCPAFAQHTFAISSVSGGSVGASVFAALTKQRSPNVGSQRCGDSLTSTASFRRSADSVLARDLLTPLFAAGLYGDLIQRAIPTGIGRLDRARALETGLEQSWSAVTGRHDLEQSFYGLWSDSARTSVPALFLNTTSVETGERMVVSGLYPLDERFNKLLSLPDLGFTRDVPLSTAAVLSARFPVVTPVGLITNGREQRRFADGGYFDDSGISTLLEMLAALRFGEDSAGFPGRPRYRLIIIRIGFEVKGNRGGGEPATKFMASGFNEVGSPIRTLLNTRGARALSAVEQLRTAVSTLQDNQHDVELVEFQLVQDRIPLVLGWLMSERARHAMTDQVPRPRQCSTETNIENDCSLGKIVRALARKSGN